MRRDSACSDKSPILRRELAHYRLDKSLRPRLESGDFSSTILESQSSTEAQITKNAQSLESTFTQSPDSSSTILESKTAQSENPTASDFAPQNKQNAAFIAKILESKKLDSSDTALSPSLRGGGKATNEAIHKKVDSTFAKLDSNMDCHEKSSDFSRNDKNNSALDYHDFTSAKSRNDRKIDSSQSSSRADKIGVAIHNSAQAESNQINNAHKVRYLESVVGGLGGVRGDKGGDFAIQAPLSPLQKNSLQTTLESSKKAQKVESTFAKIDSNMDCHEKSSDFSRNDSDLDSSLSLSSRALREQSVVIHNKKVDSNMDSKETSPIGERYPLFSKETALRLFSKEATLCHADKSARNDSNSDSALDCRADLQLPSGEKRARLAQTQCVRKKADKGGELA